ncbi:hypothetical protein S40285_08693 [Stachybotrys chlorohalonatus IBT 40285]|uniref:Uncharacterized protein n=1 Tax=Stachybotrys chlorohalonatus (strain IBT 40285) TaxID=1283841 RepID=A0A084Q7S0_STAC4|nr:hypothetical protein S40285_08693 [Stachybotrys chlorohalonata IBT 40285]
MKRHISVALYHRDHLSRGRTRKALGYEAFHWGIFTMAEASNTEDCCAFEATDISEIDPVTWRMGNPSMDWWFRVKPNVDLTLDSKLLGRIVIGAIPSEVSDVDLEQFFRQIPLPAKNTYPQQSCVTWVLDAVRALQEKVWASAFDIEEFRAWALEYADDMLREESVREDVVHYPKL